MVRGSTGDKHDPPAPPDDTEVRLESSEGNGVRVKVDSPTHGVDDRLGLLVDLLLHEVVERSLHDSGELNLERLDGTDGGDSIVAAETVDVELCDGRSSVDGLSRANRDGGSPPSAM